MSSSGPAPFPAPVPRRLDAVLGGRIRLWQPTTGYRVAIDPILLAAGLCPAAGSRLLELGCGTAAAGLSLLARHPQAAVVGLELQSDLAELARLNAQENGLADRLEVREGDLSTLPPDLNGAFDEVFFNPPYLPGSVATVSGDPQRATAHFHGDAALAAWFTTARAALRPRGELTVIFRADRLHDLLATAADAGFGSFVLLPLWPKAGRPARRVLLAARRGGRSPLVLLPGLVLHEAAGGYTAEAAAVLRGETGLALRAGRERPRVKGFAPTTAGGEECPGSPGDPETPAAKGEHERRT